MAGLVRPRMYPIRDIGSDKQDAGMIYNQKRFSGHGGLTDAAKYPRGDSGFRDVEPPTKIRTAEVSKKTSDD